MSTYIKNAIDAQSTKVLKVTNKNSEKKSDIIRSEYLDKFTIEHIENTEENMSDVNLIRLLRILDQLSSVKSSEKIDRRKLETLKNYVKESSTTLINRKYILVIKCEGAIVGTGSILIENKIIHDMGLVGHIEDIVVDEQYRGFGLAKILMKELITLAKKENCYKIILDASNDVKGFYEKLGFKGHANSMRMDL